jgi:hypothetical protein
MVEDNEVRGKKTHGFTWKFFKERIELEFVPKYYDYVSRCKFCDLMIAMNDNLHQYVRVYFGLMLEICHLHS